MTKQYYLYLDESGDFDRDLSEAWKNECLVGGLLVEGSAGISESEAKSVLLKSWKKVVTKDISLSETEILKKIRHSTELEDNKAKIVNEVLTGADALGSFVIFENYNKARIINSTVTYVNIMADGIIQLLGCLAVENPGDTIKLHVTAGFRKDTTRKVSSDAITGYIDQEECMSRIRERLALLRLKNNNILAEKSTVDFKYQDDKRSMVLILADYICNFYFTNIARIYREEYKDGLTYQKHLLQKYHSDHIFSLNGNSERERMMSFLNAQNYGNALFEVCTELIGQEENVQLLLRALIRLPEAVQMNHLQNLDNYINNIVSVERRIDDDVLKMITTAMNFLKQISDRGGADCCSIYMSMLLYKLAVHGHRGELPEMEKLFLEGRSILGRLVSKTEYLDYAFMFYNRYAVFLMDDFKVEEAFDLLERVKIAFEGMRLAIEELPDSIGEENVTSGQMGKILGTQVQCCQYLLHLGKLDYETALSISDASMENFTLEQDKRRQYQYRAQIEQEAGHYEDAVENLLKGFGHTSVDAFLASEYQNAFALYHLSAVVCRFAGEKDYENDIRKIIRFFDSNYKNWDCTKFPWFITLGNIAEAKTKAGSEKSQIKSYYERAVSVPDEEMPVLFQVLKLMMHAGYASWLLICGDSNASEISEKLDFICDKLLKKEDKLTDGMKKMIGKLREILSQGADASALDTYSRLRQY